MGKHDRKTGEALRLAVRHPSKEPSRNMVAAFLCDHVPTRGTVRCFDYPGTDYLFERKVREFIGPDRMKFIGVEQSGQLFQNAKEHMPGTGVESYPYNYQTPKQWRQADVWRSNEATLIRIPFNRFLDIAEKQQDWQENFTGWDCAWFDSCGILCNSALRNLYRAAQLFNPETPAAPVAYTFVRGLERSDFDVSAHITRGDPLEERYEAFNALMAQRHNLSPTSETDRRWVPVGFTTYQSDSPMCVVFGYFCMPKHAPDEHQLYKWQNVITRAQDLIQRGLARSFAA